MPPFVPDALQHGTRPAATARAILRYFFPGRFSIQLSLFSFLGPLESEASPPRPSNTGSKEVALFLSYVY